MNCTDRKIAALQAELAKAQYQISRLTYAAREYRKASKSLFNYCIDLEDGLDTPKANRYEASSTLHELGEIDLSPSGFTCSPIRVDPPPMMTDEEVEAANEFYAHSKDVALGLDTEGR
jgi:hypothetical protein